MPLDRVTDRTLQPAGRELAFHQIILRAGLHGFDRNRFVIGIARRDDWQLAALAL